MHILAFYPYVPYPLNRGAYYRGFYLLRELAAAHHVDFLTLAEHGEGACYKTVFQEFCRRVEIVPFEHPAWPKLFPNRLRNPLPATIGHWTLSQAGQALDDMIAGTRYDAVHLFDIILAQYFLRRHRDLPLVVDRTRVDLQYQLMERRRTRWTLKTGLLSFENLAKLWLYERRVAHRSRLQIVCGLDDAEFLRRYIRRSMPLSIIPNGVDIGYFRPSPEMGRRASEPTILFCGAMDYNPNVDALCWYFSEMHEALCHRIPDLRLWIVGKDPTPEVKAYAKRPNVVVTGGVPDVRPFYQQAWLQIVPLRIGGGTRLKIVESMAMETPVVSTTIGAQGLSLQHGEDILLADSPEAFVNQTASALQDVTLRERLARSGLETIRNTLAWPNLGKRLTAAYARDFPPDHLSQLPDTVTSDSCLASQVRQPR